MTIKISALPAATGGNITDTTVLPLVDSTTTTVKVTVAQLRTQLFTTPIPITFTADGQLMVRTAASTATQYFDIRNTSGDMLLGVEGAAPTLIGGATAYDTSLTGKTGLSFSADSGVTLHQRIASTGIVTFAKQVIVTSGGLTVTAGGATITAGGVIVTAGGVTITAGGLTVTAGDAVMAGAALATNATSGFTYIPTCAGTPTGAAGAHTGTVAFIYDTTNNKLACYNGAWKQTAALT